MGFGRVDWCSFDGFTSTFQDKLFKGYNMETFNQILYVTMCSAVLSLIGTQLPPSLPALSAAAPPVVALLLLHAKLLTSLSH